jgi:hypothetical protein
MARRIDIQPSQWVAPINEYQRLNERHLPVERRKEPDQHPNDSDRQRPERRFIALRKLVTALKKDHPFTRTDHASAEQEIIQLGVDKIHTDLGDLLASLDLTTSASAETVKKILARADQFKLINNAPTAQLDHQLFSKLTPGLKALGLSISGLKIPLIDLSCVALAERCNQRRLMASHNNLLLSVINANTGQTPPSVQEGLQLDLSVSLGVVEMDDSGRRAFVYRRADDSYVLYADKQINIEI